MSDYDPLSQYPKSRTFGADPGVPPSVSNAGREAAYGTPNMGGPAMSRGNEMPSRDSWISSAISGLRNVFGGGGDSQSRDMRLASDGSFLREGASPGDRHRPSKSPLPDNTRRPRSDGSPAYPDANVFKQRPRHLRDDVAGFGPYGE